MKNFMSPPVPNGFKHVSGVWYKAFVIEDVKSGNRFTWIPLGVLNENEEYLKKLSLEGHGTSYDFTKNMVGEYGGIYVSTYMLAKTSDSRAISLEGNVWNNISFRIAKIKSQEIAKEFRGSNVRTRLVYSAEYDAIVKTIAHLSGKNVDALTCQDFDKYGLYGMNDLWTWTLTNHSEFSMRLKKADSQNEKVYASNEFFESSSIGFRVVLIVF